MAGDIASARAAADRLPSAAAWLNTCIPVRRSSIRFLTLDKSLSPFRPYSTPVAGDHIPGMTNSSTSRASDHAMTGSHTDPAVPTMPVLFVPHGAGPCFFMDWQPPGTWDGMAGLLRGVAASLPARPRAILMVSAHWQRAGFAVTAAAQPSLIYDYYGFPEHTYALRYPEIGRAHV